MTGYWLLVAHLVGDYLLQSDWMANEKTERSVAAVAHVATYVLPFLLITQSPAALAFIAGTHFVIDRWRLARYVCWLKNWMSPLPREVPVCNCAALNAAALATEAACSDCGKTKRVAVWRHPWSECRGTGYHQDKPAWLTVWLMIIADNTLHLVCNGLALRFWG